MTFRSLTKSPKRLTTTGISVSQNTCIWSVLTPAETAAFIAHSQREYEDHTCRQFLKTKMENFRFFFKQVKTGGHLVCDCSSSLSKRWHGEFVCCSVALVLLFVAFLICLYIFCLHLYLFVLCCMVCLCMYVLLVFLLFISFVSVFWRAFVV